MNELRAPLQAQIVEWLVTPGDAVREGQVLVILEAMKMEHELRSPGAGRITACHGQPGEVVAEGDVLLI